MIIIYAENITPRLRYTLNVIFRDVLSTDFRVTDEREQALNYDGPVLCYSQKKLNSGIWLKPCGILEETGIREHKQEALEWDGMPVLYPVPDNAGWPFDPFSMIFFLVSRYEEYLPYEKDEHGRYRAEASLAVRTGFLQQPLVNELCLKIADEIVKFYPGYKVAKPEFEFQPTFDVDIAFAHLAKGFPRNILGMAKLAATGRFGELYARFSVMAGLEDDPYNNFDYQKELLDLYHLDPAYFILIGDLGPHDRNNNYRSKSFRKLIHKLAGDYSVGLHPSYKSFDNPSALSMEIGRLKEATGKPVTSSRQHYLRFALPVTYQNLLRNGIIDDYSMGYSNINGFRASISSVYYFYDLEREEETNLRIHPFCFMDTAFADHLENSPEAAVQEVSAMLSRVKRTGGKFSGVWHNYALSDVHGYSGWRVLFEEILKLTSS